MTDDENKTRQHFRVEYPPEVQPLFIQKKNQHSIIDLSERGIKFSIERTFRMKVGDKLEGKVVFSDNDETDIKGKILRLDEAYAVIYLDQRVSLQKIMEQQRFLLNKYGTLRQPKK